MIDEFSKEKDIFSALREKWREVPGSRVERVYSSDLLKYSDDDLLEAWLSLYADNCAKEGYSIRGWYHDLYASLASKKSDWLEVGGGLGFDGVFFASQGNATVTFLDIIPENLRVVERICNIKNIKNVSFKYLSSLAVINELKYFDVILAIGSLINAPYNFMSKERGLLASRLRPNGRWLELAYPYERWVREGSLPFTEWGKATDGARTPFVEWYDDLKLLKSLEPHKFEVILNYKFHSDDFIFFDLKKKPSPADGGVEDNPRDLIWK